MHDLSVDDGAWHHVEITWLPDLFKLTADYVYQTSSKTSGIQLEFTSQILIGAKQVKNVSQSNISKGFTGCITGKASIDRGSSLLTSLFPIEYRSVT